MIRGRCIEKHQAEGKILNESGVSTFYFGTGAFKLGDIIGVDEEGTVRVLTSCRAPSKPWISEILCSRRVRAMGVFEALEVQTRAFFVSQGFRSVRTSLLVRSPGMEPHIRPFKVNAGSGSPIFLPTSPEFSMKKLLVGGVEKIFQICSAFRDEPVSRIHFPEFLMLEWYRAYEGLPALMDDVEELCQHLADTLQVKPRLNGVEIKLSKPWPRYRINDLFIEMVGIDLRKVKEKSEFVKLASQLSLSGFERGQIPNEWTWDDIFFKIWLNHIEPKLPKDQAIFVTDYPASQAALSEIGLDSEGYSWAKRFEVFLGGVELANAFKELTDPKEQRLRFENDMKLREKTYGSEFPTSPIDESFIDALDFGMPPSSGIALGLDRLAMLFADETDISYLRWLPNFLSTSSE